MPRLNCLKKQYSQTWVLWQTDGEITETVSDFIFGGTPKSLQMVTAAMKLKDACSLKKSYDHPRQHIKKQRVFCQQKSVQSKVFSKSHVWMWELDHKEGWVLKNWCFWTGIGEDSCKEINPVNPKGYQSWIFIGRIDAEAETPIIWPADVKNWLI